MKAPQSSTKQQSKAYTVATRGLLDLTRTVAGPTAPGAQTRSKTGVGRVGEVPRTTASSQQAFTHWHPLPQAPIYQPLNVPPLGSKSQQARISLVNEVIPTTSVSLPRHGAVGQKAKQSVLPGWKVFASPRIDKSSRYPPSTPSRPVPKRKTQPQPQDCSLATVPNLPNPTSPGAQRPSPGGSVEGPAAPVPHAAYLAQSAIATTKRPNPQPLLLVLDLNGTLLYRPKASSAYKPRPSLSSFLSHVISNYKVLIWSSAKSQNVTGICSQIFTKAQRKLLLGEWARDTLDLTPAQYSAKVQVYKRLDRIWSTDRIQRTHPDFQNGQRWGQWNTLLLDDSVLKSSAQPYNAVVVPEFTKNGVTEEVDGTEVLGQVVAYLETARMWDNVSSFVRKHPFRVDNHWRWDWTYGRALWADEGCESDEESGGVRI
ncbi:MAG: hypothetical protein Q9209_002237 [Squamulea sp. 1 TL-2023]